MTWDDLNQDQREQVKAQYMCRLAEEGRFVSTVYGDTAYGGAEERYPSWGELCDADALISDEMARAEFGGVEFSPEDFSPPECDESTGMSPEFVKKWCEANLTTKAYENDKDRLHVNCDITEGIRYAKDKIGGMCDRFKENRLRDDEQSLLKGERDGE